MVEARRPTGNLLWRPGMEAKGGKWSSLANEVVRQPDRCGFSMARIDYPTNIHSQMCAEHLCRIPATSGRTLREGLGPVA